MIENTQTIQFDEKDASILEHAKKSASSNEESSISKNLKEALSEIHDRLSLVKSASSTNKLSTLTVEKTPMLVRTKAPTKKKSKKFRFKLRIS